MTRPEALRDAAQTVRLWMAEPDPARNDAIRLHVARTLGCHPSWAAIKTTVIRRLLSEAVAEPLRLAA